MITNSKEFSEAVSQEVCLLFRGTQITPTRELIRKAIENIVYLKRQMQPLLVEMDINIEALI